MLTGPACKSEEGCELKAKNEVNVAPKLGATTAWADHICSAGFRICAPKSLCWTCDDQILLPLLGGDDDDAGMPAPKWAAGISLPGMKLQPFYGARAGTGKNATAKQR